MKNNSKKGFSIVEVLVALSILTIVVIYLTSFFPVGLNSVISSEQKTIAINLAQAKMEEIIGTVYSDTAVGQTIEASLNSIDADFSSYSRTTNISYIDGDLNNSVTDLGLKKVEVIVNWQNSLKINQSATLITIITE